MPKLNAIQETGLEIVDFLYFYDLAALSAFTEEKKAVYGQLNNVIDDLVYRKKFVDEKAEIYRHFLLCGVEILATENPNFSSLEIDGKTIEIISPAEAKLINKKKFNIALKATYDAVCENGFDGEEFIFDVHTVTNSTGIKSRSHDVCFSLVFQELWSDTEIGVAHHAYKKFLDIAILKTDKYIAKNSYDHEGNKHLFLRIILFIEFEIMRNKLYHLHEKPVFTEKIGGPGISEKRKLRSEAFFLKMRQFDNNFKNTNNRRVSEYDWNDKDSVRKYLSAMKTDFFHNRLFSDSQNWGSLLGVGYLLYYKKIDPERAVYSDLNNEGTCSDEASKMLKERFGLCINARNLNNIYAKKIKQMDAFIGTAVRSLTEVDKHGFIGPILTQFFYYNPEMSEHLSNVLENLDVKS